MQAALAECVNHVATPDGGAVMGVAVTGTLLNLSATVLGGFSVVMARRGEGAIAATDSAEGHWGERREDRRDERGSPGQAGRTDR